MSTPVTPVKSSGGGTLAPVNTLAMPSQQQQQQQHLSIPTTPNIPGQTHTHTPQASPSQTGHYGGLGGGSLQPSPQGSPATRSAAPNNNTLMSPHGTTAAAGAAAAGAPPSASRSRTLVRRVGKYQLGKTLGQGTFGKVKLATDTETGKLFAIKVLDKAKIRANNMGEQIKKEISIMKLIKHPSVIQLVEVLASSTTIYIVLELVTGGELFDKILEQGCFAEPEAREYFHQLMDGIAQCHLHGVCHRDLKPENLLLGSDGMLKISDFGLSALSSDLAGPGGELLHTTCGTPNYVSPEVLLGGNDQKGYDGRAADIWSSGVILYVLLAGFLPFDETSMVELFRKIVKADFAYPSTLSPEAIQLLSIILNPDPVKRATMDDIRESAWYRGLTLEQAEQERIKEEEAWRIAEEQQRAAQAAAAAAVTADAARAQEQQQLHITADGTALPAASSATAGAAPAASSSSSSSLSVPPLTAAQKRASFGGNGDQPPPPQPIQGDVSLAITWLGDDKSKQLAAATAAAASAGTSAPSSSPASPASPPLSAPTELGVRTLSLEVSRASSHGTTTSTTNNSTGTTPAPGSPVPTSLFTPHPASGGGGGNSGGAGGAAMLLQPGGNFSPKVSPALSPAAHAAHAGHHGGPSALSLTGGAGVPASSPSGGANGSPSGGGSSLQARRAASRLLHSSDGAGAAGATADSNDPLALDEDESEIRGPIPLNAFDLINMVGGAAMGRMFQRGSEKKVRTFTQFTSPMKLEDILQKLQEVLTQCSETQFRIYPKQCIAKASRSTARGKILGTCQIYLMTPKLFMIEWKKMKGDVFLFHDFFREIKRRFTGARDDLSPSPSPGAYGSSDEEDGAEKRKSKSNGSGRRQQQPPRMSMEQQRTR